MSDALNRYAIPRWSEGLFNVDAHGQMTVVIDGHATALCDLVDQAQEQGARLPLLLRFPQILEHRANTLVHAFDQAMGELHYEARYTALYPIKVNQQASVVQTLSQIPGMGLEVGSKPELITALAMAQSGSTIVCNGYKDRAYIQLALAGRALGLNTLIVIEKANEWPLIRQAARDMGIEPQLGARIRLASLGAGKWQNTGGERAKFGLSAHQLMALVDELTQSGHGDWLTLLHFHMGSQISNLRDMAKGTEEAARFYVALAKRGLPIKALDIGGGLGVDYEGGASRSYCSMNYTMNQYAQTVISTLKTVCDAHQQPLPDVMSESGRALTAHHAVMVTDVTATEPAPPEPKPAKPDSPEVLQALAALWHQADTMPPEECFDETEHRLEEGRAAFLKGDITLDDRAELEPYQAAILSRLLGRLDADHERHRRLRDRIRLTLSDKYFINLSIFQSLPDIWAIDQVFPIVPLTRLNETPDRRAVLEDLTCDSDGRIDHYVDRGLLEATLAVHSLAPGERYLLGIFMAGAYQETLGDIHNLFGDTDTVDVRIIGDEVSLSNLRPGDTAEALLSMVGYNPATLLKACTEKVQQSGLQGTRAEAIATLLADGLKAYTYLESHYD